MNPALFALIMFGSLGLMALAAEGISALLDRQPIHRRRHSGPMRHPVCACGEPGVRSDQFDCYYCPASGAWLEDKCSDPGCQFCARRPRRGGAR